LEREKEVEAKANKEANKLFGYLTTGAVVGASIMKNLGNEKL
jgi:hypothetical protein